MNGESRRTSARISGAYVAILLAAFVWFAFNCIYVYGPLHGQRLYRLESSAIILVSLLAFRMLAAPGPTPRTELPERHARLLLLTVAVVWTAGASRLIAYPFLSDDYVFLGRYHSLSDVLYVSTFFRPAFALVFLVSRRLGADSTVPFHIIGFALHLGSAYLLHSLAGRLTGSRTMAAIATAAFILNPLQLEATLWISGMQELLWTFFLLCSVRIYLDGPAVRLRTTALALLPLVCALLSKETAVCYGLLLPLLDVWLGRVKRTSSAVASYAVLAVLICAYVAVRSRFTVIEPGFFAPPTQYFVKQFILLPYRFFVQPWSAAVIRSTALPLIVSLVGAALFTAGVVRGTLSRRAFIGPLLVLCASMPLYTYFFVTPELMSARYLYFPFIGWSLLLGELLTTSVRDTKQLTVALSLVVVAYAAFLGLNLGPWNRVGQLIHVMEAAVDSGVDPRAAARQWQLEQGAPLKLSGSGVPMSYRGVMIFVNGYQEFVNGAGRRP
jgi:hypothetical protein